MNTSENNKKTALSPSALFGDLPVLKFRFHTGFSESARLSQYTGFAWRGLLGWELKKMVCPFDHVHDCNACTIKDHCPYFMLFEYKTSFPGLAESPRGYVVYPGNNGNSNFKSVDITLMGRCTRFAAIISNAFFRMQNSGFGSDRVPFEISSWGEVLPDGSVNALPKDQDGHLSARGPYPFHMWVENKPDMKKSLEIKICTPLRLRKKGQYKGDMDWSFFFATLVRRLEALNVFYNNGYEIGKENWLILQEEFKSINVSQCYFKWQEMTRYSSRQKKKIQMGGITGRAVITEPSDFTVQWWKAAELVHIGKGVSMGLGKVCVL